MTRGCDGGKLYGYPHNGPGRSAQTHPARTQRELTVCIRMLPDSDLLLLGYKTAERFGLTSNQLQYSPLSSLSVPAPGFRAESRIPFLLIPGVGGG